MIKSNTLSVLFILTASLFLVGPLALAQEKAEAKAATAKATKGLYRHVVLFQFKETATAEQIAEVEKAFAELPDKIDSIIDYEWGTNVSPEGHDNGLTHCFLVTFADKAGLEKYLPHPAHKAFVKMLGPVLEKPVVIDYVSK